MPNGHGGVPFLGGPIVIALLLAFFVAFARDALPRAVWVGGCVGLAGLIGWRIAYHLHMRHADEYGGAYIEPDAYRRARRRYLLFAPLYAVLAAAAGFLIAGWRGGP